MGLQLILKWPHEEEIDLAHRQTWMIGRGRGSDISIEHPSISRRHAILHVTDGGEVYLVDCGSRNGSFVNGYRAGTRLKLISGDLLGFADTQAEFRAGTDWGQLQ